MYPSSIRRLQSENPVDGNKYVNLYFRVESQMNEFFKIGQLFARYHLTIKDNSENFVHCLAGKKFHINTGVGYTGLVDNVSIIVNSQAMPNTLTGDTVLNRASAVIYKATPSSQRASPDQNVIYPTWVDPDTKLNPVYPTWIDNEEKDIEATPKDLSILKKVIAFHTKAGANGRVMPMDLPIFPFHADLIALRSKRGSKESKYFPPNTSIRIGVKLVDNPSDFVLQLSQTAPALGRPAPDVVKLELKDIYLLVDYKTIPIESKFFANFKSFHKTRSLNFPMTVPREFLQNLTDNVEKTRNVFQLRPLDPDLIRVYFITDLKEYRKFCFPANLITLTITIGEYTLIDIDEIGTSKDSPKKMIAFAQQAPYLRYKPEMDDFFGTDFFSQILTFPLSQIKHVYKEGLPQLEIVMGFNATKSPTTTTVCLQTVNISNLILQSSGLYEIL